LDKEDNWIQYKPPGNEYSSVRKSTKQGLTPVYSFTRERSSFENVHNVVNARGGCYMSFYAPSGRWDGYERTMERVRGMEFDAIMIKQGAKEAYIGDVSTWLADLKEVVSAFRAEFGNIPVIIGQVYNSKEEYQEKIAELNAIMLDAPNHIDNLGVVSSEGLTAYDEDGWHLDERSADELGIRYSKKLDELMRRD
jgi:hypothetical protein